MAEHKKCSLGKGGREDLASSCNMDRVALELPVSVKLKSQKMTGERILEENYYTGKDEQESANTPKQNYSFYISNVTILSGRSNLEIKHKQKIFWNTFAFSTFGSLAPLAQSKQQKDLSQQQIT